MWTRQIGTGRGSVMGAAHSDEDINSNFRHHLTFEEEFYESPSEYKKRKQARKRASIDDNNNDPPSEPTNN